MKQTLLTKGIIWGIAAFLICGVAQARVFNLYDEMVKLGLYSAECVESSANAAGAKEVIFNGVKEHPTSTGQRWLSTIDNGAYATINVPDSIALSSRIIGYRIWRLTNGYNELIRSPSECELYGVTSQGVTNLLSRATGIKWWGEITEGQKHEVFDLDLHDNAHYTKYVFKPTKSDYSYSSINNIGLMELEILMTDDLTDFAQYANITFSKSGKEYVQIALDPSSDFEHVYKTGTQVTLTAPESYDGRDFAEWRGTGFSAGPTAASIIVTAGNEYSALPFYAGMWFLQKDSPSRNSVYSTGTLTEIGTREDGNNWVLNVGSLNESAKTFSIGLAGDQNGSIFNVENGEVVGSGKCDLSAPVVTEDGVQWRALSIFKGQQFRAQGATLKMTEFIAPKTLETFAGNQQFNGINVTLTNIVFDCPLMTGSFVAWDFPHSGRLVLKCPKITKIEGRVFGSGTSLENTDVSEWDLSGVTELKWLNNKQGVFEKAQCRGVLHLPGIKTVGVDSFKDTPNLEGVILGSEEGTVTSIGANAFGGTCGIKKLEINGAKGWTLEKGAISFAENLTDVTFRAEPPTFVGSGASEWTGIDAAAKRVCFFVPFKDARWDAWFGSAVAEAADADVQSWMNANPDGTSIPRGEVSGAGAKMQNSQLVGYCCFPRTWHPWVYTPNGAGTGGTISDGNWVLNVYVANQWLNKLGLGTESDCDTHGNAYTGIGYGALDLNGDIVNANNASEIWHLTDFGKQCLSREGVEGTERGASVVTELYMPTNTQNIGSEKIMYSDKTVTTLKRLWIDMPEYSGSVGAQAFQGHEIAKATINMPKVNEVKNRAFQDIVDIEGKLVLGRVTYLGNNDFNNTGLEEADIGTNIGKDEKKVLTDGDSPSFQMCMANNPGLKKITFGPYAEMRFNADAFLNNTGYEEIEFWGKPVTRDAIDKILVSIPNITEGSKVVIKASKRLVWDALATPATSAETSQGLPDGVNAAQVLGVYEGANGKRNAWIVDFRSPCDPDGITIIIR